MGVARRFREEAQHVQCYSMQPDSSFHGLEGLKHMATAIVPGIYDPSLPHGNIDIATEEAHQFVRRIAREEGILVGISAGANIAASHRLAREMHQRGERGLIVTVICDSADKYLSEHFWDDSD
jgi:cysteine synthase B